MADQQRAGWRRIGFVVVLAILAPFAFLIPMWSIEVPMGRWLIRGFDDQGTPALDRADG